MPSQPIKTEIVIAKGNSAASSHYLRPKDKEVLEDIEKHHGPSVVLPNNKLISSTQNGQITLSALLLTKAQTASMLPKLDSS